MSLVRSNSPSIASTTGIFNLNEDWWRTAALNFRALHSGIRTYMSLVRSNSPSIASTTGIFNLNEDWWRTAALNFRALHSGIRIYMSLVRSNSPSIASTTGIFNLNENWGRSSSLKKLRFAFVCRYTRHSLSFFCLEYRKRPVVLFMYNCDFKGMKEALSYGIVIAGAFSVHAVGS